MKFILIEALLRQRKLMLAFSHAGMVVVFALSCHAPQALSEIRFKDYPVGKSEGVDSVYIKMLSPYSDSLSKSMNEVLCSNERELFKDQPNNDLGNFMADAYLWAAREILKQPADMAFMNHGGVRINRLGKGVITRTNAYEMMPFDNQLVNVEVRGTVLRQFVDRLAVEGGGGGVAGINYRIVDKKAIDIRVGGQPLDDNRVYHMVNSDYVVEGGGGFKGFQSLPQLREGYLLRDAIIDYCRMHNNKGMSVQVGTEKRISQ